MRARPRRRSRGGSWRGDLSDCGDGGRDGLGLTWFRRCSSSDNRRSFASRCRSLLGREHRASREVLCLVKAVDPRGCRGARQRSLRASNGARGLRIGRRGLAGRGRSQRSARRPALALSSLLWSEIARQLGSHGAWQSARKRTRDSRLVYPFTCPGVGRRASSGRDPAFACFAHLWEGQAPLRTSKGVEMYLGTSCWPPAAFFEPMGGARQLEQRRSKAGGRWAAGGYPTAPWAV